MAAGQRRRPGKNPVTRAFQALLVFPRHFLMRLFRERMGPDRRYNGAFSPVDTVQIPIQPRTTPPLWYRNWYILNGARSALGFVHGHSLTHRNPLLFRVTRPTDGNLYLGALPFCRLSRTNGSMPQQVIHARHERALGAMERPNPRPIRIVHFPIKLQRPSFLESNNQHGNAPLHPKCIVYLYQQSICGGSYVRTLVAVHRTS